MGNPMEEVYLTIFHKLRHRYNIVQSARITDYINDSKAYKKGTVIKKETISRIRNELISVKISKKYLQLVA